MIKLIMQKKFVIVVIGVIIIIGIIFSNPLRWPKELIRANILKLTPIGTNMDDTIEIIKNKEKWGNYDINYNSRYVNDEKKLNSLGTVIGEKFIEVLMGNYTTVFVLPMATYVTVYWAFDKDSNLIDVYVIKTYDMP